MQLTYVESSDTYWIYEDEDGEEVFLAHGNFQRLTPIDEIDLLESWRTYCRAHHWSHLQANGDRWQNWLSVLQEQTTEPEFVGEIVPCHNGCGKPMFPDDSGSHAVYDGHACEACFAHYYSCTRCEGSFRDTTTTLDDSEVCEGCRDGYYSYCDDCDGYYRDDDNHHHGDDDDCGCDAPARRFSVRNDGESPLANDERVTIGLPAGEISNEGMQAIVQHLRTTAMQIEDRERQRKFYNLAQFDILMNQIGPTWQTKQGNFTKRLSRYAYKDHQLKLAPETISTIGCIARDHSTAIDFHLEVTRNLNLSADEFGNEGSCWWNSYSQSRCALKSNGGYGLRSFDDGNTSYPSGRAWVMPLKQGESKELLPTFDTDAAAFVVFNGYGALHGYVPARIVAHMAGMTYRKIVFTCTPMYVNGGSGYLIAPEEIAQPYTDGSLHLAVGIHSDLFETERKELANVA